MKRLTFVILIGCLVSLSLSSCWGPDDSDDFDRRYSLYEPVVLNRTTFESSIRFGELGRMKQAGKIYVYNQWIFISDLNKGFHVYDNSNPNTPVLKSFIEAPGATDMAIRNNIIYINHASDLLTLQIDPVAKKVEVLKRIKSVFPNKKSPDGYSLTVDRDKEVIVDWIKK